MNYKAVIFDLDGTLYDNSVLKLLVPIYNAGHLRLVLAERAARKSMAGEWTGTPQEVFKRLFDTISSSTDTNPQAIGQWYRESYMPSMIKAVERFCHKRSWVDGVLAGLKRQGCRTACFSDYDFVEQKLRALRIDPSSFDLIIDAAQAGGLKPCKESFAAVAAGLGVAAADTLVVGDREDTDGAGAASAGMHFLNVSRLKNPLTEILK